MLRAVIFDFNGIIVDDEPIHFQLFQRVLGEEGIALTEESYYARYLGFDDRGAFTTGFRENGRPLSGERLGELIDRKARYYQQAIRDHVEIFPGVARLVAALANTLPLAIASGALRQEIEAILETAQIRQHFRAIVSAEDVRQGKPDPEIFIKALDQINLRQTGSPPIAAAECVVIEDSKEGIKGARSAGMTCLAVTNSHPADLLADAHGIVNSLESVDIGLLERLCG